MGLISYLRKLLQVQETEEQKAKRLADEKTLAEFRKYNEYATSSGARELNENFLFDFRADMYGNSMPIASSGRIANVQLELDGEMGDMGDTVNPSEEVPKPQKMIKIAVKPIDVFDELERLPTPFSLEMLDQKIEMTKARAAMVKQHYTKRELEGILERLEFRKKYSGAVKDYFSKFDTTSDEKIAKLLAKYKLEQHTSDLFIPEFPDEAIATMTEYTKQVEELTGKKPVFYVISEANDFKQKWDRRDPILLAQSPFGFFYDILGVWGDEHMQTLFEL